MKFSIIVAVDQNFGIGYKNTIPWRLSADMKYFKQITTDAAPGKQNAVVMGLNTWVSLPKQYRPLSDRRNIVLCPNLIDDLPEDVHHATSFEHAFELLSDQVGIDKVFFIGGESVYRAAIQLPNCEKLYITHVDSAFDCDTYFPKVPTSFSEASKSDIQTENDLSFCFSVYKKTCVN